MNPIRMDLQYFAQEKTEKATPKKRQESRKKGQVARSAEVPAAFIMICVFTLLFFIGGYMGSILLGVFHHSFEHYVRWDVTEQNIPALFQEITWEAVRAVTPVMLVSLVAGVLGNYIQVGFLAATDPLKMKLERVNPLKGFKRIFSIRAIVELTKSVFKILLIGSVVSVILWVNRDQVWLLSQQPVANSLAVIGGLAVQIGLVVAVILIFLSILDYMYQKYDFEKNIRMSKQDIKDEYKKTEGDPQIKSKMKERQREMAMRRMMQEVPKADVVITNPTHYAVALRYDAEEMDAPQVVAKGTDYIALKMKEKAKQSDIVVTENRPLARALYDQTEIGDAVPEHLYQAVAEILAYVYRLKGAV